MRTRPRHLECIARHLGIAETEIDDRSYYGRRHLIAKLERRLRAERARGLARHWSYELPRHAALFAAWRIERKALGRAFADPPAWKPSRPIGSGRGVQASLVSPTTDNDARPHKPRQEREADAQG